MLVRLSTYLLSCLIMLGLTQPSLAGTAPLLTRMAKEGDLASSRIALEFSVAPEYRIEPSGQRVDLFFTNASTAPTLRLLPEDDKIVKVLVAKSNRELMVSLLLRQVPANITVAEVAATATVNLELFWQEANNSRPAIAFRISGLPSRQVHSSSSQPLLKSKYYGQWHKFFAEYDSPLRMNLPARITVPPLPRFGLEQISKDFSTALEAIEKNHSEDALKSLQKIPSADLNQQGLLIKQLLKAEALLRQGTARQALYILDNLPHTQLPRKLQQRAGYLQNLAMALNKDHFGAMTWHAELKELLADSPYRYPFQLLQAEIALTNGDGEEALKTLLLNNSRWPKKLQSIRKLRIADAQVATGQSREALAHYRRLMKGPGIPAGNIFSLHQAALAFAENHQFEKSYIFYQQLANQLTTTELKSEALFLRAMSAYRGNNKKAANLQFRLLREDYPETLVDYRTRMKIIDQGIANTEDRFLRQGIRDYPLIASRARDRRVSEEAAFKHGVSLHLHREPLQAIEALGQFRRNFASSPLRGEAEALMAEILPAQLEKLIANGEDMQAVVLLERYRELLIRGDGKWPFLPKLAKAFTRLGLFDRGCRVYLYLLDHARSDAAAEMFFLPLASLYFDQDEFKLVERYSRHYMEKYPKGKDRTDLFLLRLQALKKMERLEEAASLLEEKKLPRNNDIELLAAEIYWELGDYNRVIDFANRLGDRGEAIPPAGLLLEAEALRRLGHGPQALPLYEVLAEDGTYSDQATYRCGQILLAKGEKSKALNLFKNLAEKGKNNLWRELAQDFISAETYN